MGKYYAVKRGRKTGIFETWGECQAQVKGYPGAKFKSFQIYDEALAYIEDVDLVMQNDIKPRLEMGKLVAFTDGSYDDKKNMYGAGTLIFVPGDSIEPFNIYGAGDTEEFLPSKNVAGEIMAVINAIDYAVNNNYAEISIFHDYEGISKWATGEWSTNKPCSIYYQEYIRKMSSEINIEFIKVEGHSNNKYNDMADRLAKTAIRQSSKL